MLTDTNKIYVTSAAFGRTRPPTPVILSISPRRYRPPEWPELPYFRLYSASLSFPSHLKFRPRPSNPVVVQMLAACQDC
jgi:hypothetical protein